MLQLLRQHDFMSCGYTATKRNGVASQKTDIFSNIAVGTLILTSVIQPQSSGLRLQNQRFPYEVLRPDRRSA
jgi:hypothetical protein